MWSEASFGSPTVALDRGNFVDTYPTYVFPKIRLESISNIT